jgi:7-cyano-7-deazaguanine reductase
VPSHECEAHVGAGARLVGMEPIATSALTILGQTVHHPIPHVECFDAPDGCTRVRFTTDEVASMCPVTAQPDLSHVVIEYEPDGHCVESKSLKLYLWGFRDRAVFAEALAVEIADEIMSQAAPRRVTVTLTQRPRGGISLEATAERRGGAGVR